MVCHDLGILLFCGCYRGQGETGCIALEDIVKVLKCVGLANCNPRLGIGIGNPSPSNLHITLGIHIRSYWSNGDVLGGVTHDDVLIVNYLDFFEPPWRNYSR